MSSACFSTHENSVVFTLIAVHIITPRKQALGTEEEKRATILDKQMPRNTTLAWVAPFAFNFY